MPVYGWRMRVGVIGAGWIAADHIEILDRLPNTELVAVCDINEARAREAARSRPTYVDWNELIERESPDALVVCTPPLAHRDVTVAALEQGIHVYLEKPIARGLEDARAIMEASEQSGGVCAVGYQWRAAEILDDLRAAIAGQDIGFMVGICTGPTQSRPWFLDRAQGGGNLLERASHQIDLERVLGGEVVSVQAAASTVALAQSAGDRGDIEDAAALVLHFATGALGGVQVAWTRGGLPGTYSLDIFANEASLHLTVQPVFELTGVSRNDKVETASSVDPLERSLTGFLEAARADDPARVFCSPRDAAGTLAIVVACEEALASGGTIPVPAI
jgi:myo-inositol 2-dehydrogenase/D-chiro-inositol 1-dehydrogenase